jgi:hypothetical protein
VRSHEVDGQHIGSVFYFLYNEDLYPDRVKRLPPDGGGCGARLYRGVITSIDTS